MRTSINGTLCFVDVGGPSRQIIIKGKVFYFEMHPHCGPMPCKRDGNERKHVPKIFWEAVTLWAQQGQRVENGICQWEYGTTT